MTAVPDVHACAAAGCLTSVPAQRLMCRSHWFQVPRLTRIRVWAEYRPGQTAASATEAYVVAANEAIQAVKAFKDREGGE